MNNFTTRDCTNQNAVLANSIGMDIGSTSHPSNQNGEWGVYGTHLLNCEKGVAMVDTNVMQWYGVMEVSQVSNSGTVGFQIDSTTAGKGGGNYIGGSINNYETAVKIGQTINSSAPFNTTILASITNSSNPLSIAPGSIPTTLRLTPSGVLSAPQLHGSATLKDEFFSGNLTSGTIGELGWAVNAAVGSVSQIAGSTNHPGVIQRSSATGPAVALFQLNSSGTNLPIAALSSGVVWDSTFIFSLEQTTGLTVRAGFCNNCATSPPTNGIYFENSGASQLWTGVAKAGSTITTVPTTPTIGLDTAFHTLEIQSDGITINYLFDHVLYGSILASSTSVPTSALGPFFAVASTDGTVKNLDIDAFQFDLQVTR